MVDSDWHSRFESSSFEDALGLTCAAPGNRLLQHWHSAPVEDDNTPLRFAQDLHQLPPGRRELVFRIRRQIAEGAYESEQKLSTALDRLIEQTDAMSDPDLLT